MFAPAGGQDGAFFAVERDADHLEPAVLVRDVKQAGGARQPARARLPGILAGDKTLAACGHVQNVDLRGEQVGQSLRRHGDVATVRRPHEVVHVDAGRSQWSGLGRAWPRCRAAAARHWRIHDPELIPAAAARDERDLMAVGAPTRRAVAGRMLRDEGLVRPLRVNHPDRFASDMGDSATVRRPLRIRDRIFRGSQLLWVAATYRHQEDLASAPGLGRECNATAIRRETELARRLDRRGLLHGQAIPEEPPVATVIGRPAVRLGHSPPHSNAMNLSSRSPSAMTGSTRTNVSRPNICSSWERVSGSSQRRPCIWLSWQARAAILRSRTEEIGTIVVISSSGRASFSKAWFWRMSSSVGGVVSPERRRSSSWAACIPATAERDMAWWYRATGPPGSAAALRYASVATGEQVT